MVTRRDALGVAALALAGSTAGCLDAVPFLGDEPTEFAATPASVPDPVLEETGYQERRTEETTAERTFEVGDRTQDVVVTNWQAEYDRAVDLGTAGLPTDERLQAAIFTALSTPQVAVLGRTFNPVADMSPAELAGTVQDRYDGVGELRQVGEAPAAIGGQSVTVGEFETEAELQETGMTVDLVLHISEAVESGDDLIVAVGGYPRVLQEQERERIFTLMAGIEHG
jgi:hypothetical protein